MDKFVKFEKKVEKKILPYVDEMFYLGAILSPLVALPQVYTIFSMQSAEGVSLLSWISYFVGALCLLVYGIVHKQKPIILMNLTVLPVYLLIVVGILIYGK